MNTTAATTTTSGATKATPIPACSYYIPTPTPTSIEYSAGAGSAKEESRVLLICLRGIAAICWAASRRTLERMLLAYLQSAVNPTWHSLISSLTATAGPRGVTSADQAQVLHDKESAVVARHAAGGACTSPKRVFWSYLRGVSLALSELCQDCHYGGGRIPLSAILDLMRQHQSAFVPLGPQVEKDVPKRLIQLANEHVVFFDPFEEYVVVPEETRQKYVSRRQELLAVGVDPADLSVFGAALTQDLSPSKRVTNAAVASYKEQFLLTQQQQQHQKKMSKSRAPTREESLMSIADAIRPPDPKYEIVSPDTLRVATRRGGGHSESWDDDLLIDDDPPIKPLGLFMDRSSWIWRR